MSEQIPQSGRELVVLVTRGADHELSSVAFTIACGAVTSGMKVYAFLVSSAVDLVRRKAVDITHVPPLDPLKSLIQDFMARGGTIWACPRASRLAATHRRTSSMASAFRGRARCSIGSR